MAGTLPWVEKVTNFIVIARKQIKRKKGYGDKTYSDLMMYFLQLPQLLYLPKAC